MKKKITIYNYCILKIRPTSNNIFVTLTNIDGKVILKSSAGIEKFNGKKKGTAYVAEVVAKNLILSLNAKQIRVNMLILELQGFVKNYAFKRIIKNFQKIKVTILMGVYVHLKKAHNGMRSKKAKRL